MINSEDRDAISKTQ